MANLEVLSSAVGVHELTNVKDAFANAGRHQDCDLEYLQVAGPNLVPNHCPLSLA